jgi:transcription termination/antitermination protein NusG
MDYQSPIYDGCPPREPEEAWFAVQVTPRHENKVATYLEYKGLISFVPVRKVKRQWSDRTKVIDWPLFPTYVFCRFCRFKAWTVRSIPGVSRIVGSGFMPSPIPDWEIESLRKAITSGVEIVPTTYLRCGEKIQIKDGPLTGVSGVVVRMTNRNWLVISVDLIGKSVMAHVPISAVTTVTDHERNRLLS